MITKMMQGLRISERGAVAVELAVLAPVIFFLFAGLVDVGLMLYQRTVVGTAADAGAVYALFDPNFNPAVPINSQYQSDIQQAVIGSYDLSFPLVSGPAIQATPAPSTFCGCPTGAPNYSITIVPCSTNATCPGTDCSGSACPAGTYVQVNAQSNYTPLLPWSGIMGSGAVPMTAKSVVRIQ